MTIVYKNIVLFFVKFPEKGNIKSRLASFLGENFVTKLYECFVLDFMDTLTKGGHEFRICYYPASSGAGMMRWLGEGHLYMPQEGEDLGDRMKNAFEKSFSSGFEKVLLIGSDIPDLKNSVIEEAFESLDRSDAVIGPASDGGYYLIGFRKDAFLPGIFYGISWGGESVFDVTMKIFKQSGRVVHILPEWRDVDTIDDLRALFNRNIDTDFRRSRTMACIMKNKNEIFHKSCAK